MQHEAPSGVPGAAAAGDPAVRALRDDPESYGFSGWADDLGGKLLRTMLAAAERLA